MTKFLIIFLVQILAVASFAMPPKANVSVNSVHSRNYGFSFTHGNMLPNWSFEDGYYGWRGGRKSRAELASTYGADVQPVTGSYVGFSGWDRDTDWSDYLVSDLVPVGEDSVYTLSLFSYHVKGIAAAPRIFFYSNADSQSSFIDVKSYDQNARWSFYTYTFKIPEGTHYVGFSLSTTLNAVMFFDDVILEPGREASPRGSVGMGISFSDDLGRRHMSETLVHREFANVLLPSECVNGYAVYANEKVEIGARSVLRGGNVGSSDTVFVDNDVVLRDTMLSEMRVDAKNSVRVGDRDSIYATVRYGRLLNRGNQVYVQNSEKYSGAGQCLFPQEEYPIGTSDKTVLNDADYTLAPGMYKNVMVRARGKLRLSAGDYYFDRFSVEPTAQLYFDVTQGNVVIHVKSSLSINDNSSMFHDSTAKYFIGWRLGQSENLRLGTISGLAGVFVAPNARIELGHQSHLYGLLFAREVNLMQNSKLTAPSFLFYDPTMRFVVGEARYDAFGRIVQSDYSYIASLESEGYVDSSSAHANEYFSFYGDGPDAGGYAFSEREYSDKDGRLLKRSLPGEPWRIDGEHVGTSNYGYVSDLNIPQSIFVLSGAPKKYKLSYARDLEGRMAITWKNNLGQVVQTAVSIDTIAGAPMKAYRWSITKYEYTREGKLYRTITPLDVEQGGDAFAVVSEYDAAGRMVSRTGPDVGTEKFYYNKAGGLRLSVSEEQRARKAFSYRDYDAQGRVVSSGESVLGVMTDASLRQIAESTSPVPGTKTEYSGIAYDTISSCLDKLNNVNLSAYFAGKRMRNALGRVSCTWTRNPQVAIRIGSEQALIADFYSYDSLGREEISVRYTGIESDPTRKFVSRTYEYDDLSRVFRVTVADANGIALDVREFRYDEKGRVSGVLDGEGEPIVRFTYDDEGMVTAVNVGDRLETNYAYHLHGQVNAFNVRNRETGDTLFKQKLDYENIAATATEKPRFDGMLSRLSTKYGLSDTSGNRISSFLYDMTGNLVKRSGTAPEATYSFDKNGRMLTQGYDGSTWSYDYKDGSYELSRVLGTIALDSTRDASRPNNFVYDASGRMVADSSKNLTVEYNPNGMPVKFVQSAGSSTWQELMLYDPSGWRVATLDYENNTLQMLRTDIMAGGQKVLERRKVYAGNDSSVAEYKMIRGRSGIVGRVLPNSSKEWYVKDYQGSLVMTLLNDETGNVFVYEPYGAQMKVKVTGDSPAEQYTGKEYNERLGLYYYGARFYDPILGVWISPDAARQFNNPFHFGGNPVNYVDIDGNIVVQVAIAALSIYIAIDVAYKMYDGTNLVSSLAWGTAAGTLNYLGGSALGAIKGIGGAAIGSVTSMGVYGIQSYAESGSFGSPSGYVASGTMGALASSAARSVGNAIGVPVRNGKVASTLGSLGAYGISSVGSSIVDGCSWGTQTGGAVSSYGYGGTMLDYGYGGTMSGYGSTVPSYGYGGTMLDYGYGGSTLSFGYTSPSYTYTTPDFGYTYEPLKIEVPEVEVPKIEIKISEPPKIRIDIPPTNPDDLGQYYIDIKKRDLDDWINGLGSNINTNINYGF